MSTPRFMGHPILIGGCYFPSDPVGRLVLQGDETQFILTGYELHPHNWSVTFKGRTYAYRVKNLYTEDGLEWLGSEQEHVWTPVERNIPHKDQK